MARCTSFTGLAPGAAMHIRQLWLAAWQYWVRTMQNHPPTGKATGKEWWLPSTDMTESLVPVARAAFTAR